jgi:hypothetical protein
MAGRRMTILKTLLGLAALGLSAGAASAADHRLTTRPGAPLPLTVETAMTADCMVRQVPETRIVTAPEHGAVTVHEGSLTRQGAGCPPAAGYVILYIPEADFMGQDVVSIEVEDAGERTTMHFNITVEAESASRVVL